MTQNRFSYFSLLRCFGWVCSGLRYLSTTDNSSCYSCSVSEREAATELLQCKFPTLWTQRFPPTCAQTWKWSCRWGRWRCHGGARPAMRWCAATGWARPVGRCRWQDVGLSAERHGRWSGWRIRGGSGYGPAWCCCWWCWRLRVMMEAAGGSWGGGEVGVN